MKALRGSYTHYTISYRELVHVAGGAVGGYMAMEALKELWRM